MLGLRASRFHHHHVAANVVLSRHLLLKGFTTSSSRHSNEPLRARTERQRREDAIHKAPWHVWVSLGFVMVIGFQIARLASAIAKASNDDTLTDLSQQKDVAARYDEIADNFDSDVNISEWLMGLMRVRKRLANMCKGNVLEVSCGTGRNLGYYEYDNPLRKVKSLTLVDLSPQMIEVCKRKFKSLRAGKARAEAGKTSNGVPNDTVVRFLSASALGSMPLAPDGKKYDTIMQTMGICSTPSPVELVINMARHLDMQNPDARIFLLEHGRSHYNWLNKVIDGTASKHADEYGCWYNRDVDGIIKEAAEKAGLVLVHDRRKHLGTTFIYELKPGANAVQQSHPTATHAPESRETPAPSWMKWLPRIT